MEHTELAARHANNFPTQSCFHPNRDLSPRMRCFTWMESISDPRDSGPSHAEDIPPAWRSFFHSEISDPKILDPAMMKTFDHSKDPSTRPFFKKGDVHYEGVLWQRGGPSAIKGVFPPPPPRTMEFFHHTVPFALPITIRVWALLPRCSFILLSWGSWVHHPKIHSLITNMFFSHKGVLSPGGVLLPRGSSFIMKEFFLPWGSSLIMEFLYHEDFVFLVFTVREFFQHWGISSPWEFSHHGGVPLLWRGFFTMREFFHHRGVLLPYRSSFTWGSFLHHGSCLIIHLLILTLVLTLTFPMKEFSHHGGIPLSQRSSFTVKEFLYHVGVLWA